MKNTPCKKTTDGKSHTSHPILQIKAASLCWLVGVAELETYQLRQKDVRFPCEITTFALSFQSSV